MTAGELQLAPAYICMEDDSLYLRRLGTHPSDAQNLYETIQANPHIGEFESWVERVKTPESAQRYVDAKCLSMTQGYSLAYNVIAGDPHSEGELWGGAQLLSIMNKRDGRQAHMACWTTQAAQGRSVAYRAVRSLARHGFEVCEIDRIGFSINKQNTRSIRLATRLGAQLTGRTIVMDGQPYSQWVVTPQGLTNE